MKKGVYKKIEPIAFYILAVVTAFWFFFFINKGIDVTDTAYYLAKYKYYFEPGMELKSIGTFLTDVFGAFLYNLSDSGQVFILSIAHWALYMVSGLFVYKCLKKYVPRIMLILVIFMGSLFSLTWIHVMNYNATSMFMQTIAICVLIKGFEKENKYYFILAGFLFGINTFFRLPNILQIVIGVSIIWYYGFCKAEWEKGFKHILAYVTGVIIAGVIGGSIAINIIGIDKIKDYLFRTASTASDSSDSHGIISIFKGMFSGLLYGIIDWVCNVGLWIIILIVFVIILKKITLTTKQKMMLYLCFVGESIVYGVYVGKCLEYISFYQMTAVGIIFVIVIGSWNNRKTNAMVSTINIICLCAEAVLCIGTDNAWYYQVVFLMLPLAVCAVTIYQCQDKHLKEYLTAVAILVSSMVLTVGLRYSTQYVYRDATNAELVCSINAQEYKGIYTSKERAKYLNELQSVLEEFNGKELLAYGDCNIGYVITDMKPFLKNKIWIDLESYSVERFENELEEELRDNSYPIVLLADLDKNGAYRSEAKLEIIESLLYSGEYEKYYDNGWYCIYRSVL